MKWDGQWKGSLQMLHGPQGTAGYNVEPARGRRPKPHICVRMQSEIREQMLVPNAFQDCQWNNYFARGWWCYLRATPTSSTVASSASQESCCHCGHINALIFH